MTMVIVPCLQWLYLQIFCQLVFSGFTYKIFVNLSSVASTADFCQLILRGLTYRFSLSWSSVASPADFLSVGLPFCSKCHNLQFNSFPPQFYNSVSSPTGFFCHDRCHKQLLWVLGDHSSHPKPTWRLLLPRALCHGH